MSPGPKKKPRLFLLFPGPKYNLRDFFEQRCALLSRDFEGTILTSGPEAHRLKYGSFDIICIRDPYVKSLFSTLNFVLFAVFILLKNKIIGRKFDLFVTYDPLKTGLIGLMVTYITKIKRVVEVNGDYTQDVIYWHIKEPWRRRLRKRAMLAVENIVLKNAAGIKLLYDDQVTYFEPLRNRPVIAKFPNFVNADGFWCIEDRKEILTIGFPFWIKGIDLLISAFKSISEEYPEWRLKIVGYYPDKTLLDAYIGDDERISYHDPVDHTLVPEHTGRCGIFVLASRTEAMGRVLVEAMAAGKPRIGARTGGIPTVINDGKDGLLFEPGSAEDLAKKLKLLMSSPAMRSDLGSTASARFKTEFGPDQYYGNLRDFYLKVLASD